MKEGEFEISVKMEGGKVVYGRRSTVEERRLVYDAERCVGCHLCMIPCPVDAIDLGATASVARELVDAPQLVVDMERCTFCGICSETCPFNAYEFYIDGEPIRGREEYPGYERRFEMKVLKKGTELREALEKAASTCPRGALVAENRSLRFVEKECIYCQGCVEQEEGVEIKVSRVIEGSITVDNERCQGCGACRDVCPTKAPYYPAPPGLGERGEKTAVNVSICNFCGACEIACPVDAIKVERRKINYKVKKEAPWTRMWVEAFEKLRTAAGEVDNGV